jgi:hypothetical protein
VGVSTIQSVLGAHPAIAAIALDMPALIHVCLGLLFSFVNAGRTIEDQAAIALLKEVQPCVKK